MFSKQLLYVDIVLSDLHNTLRGKWFPSHYCHEGKQVLEEEPCPRSHSYMDGGAGVRMQDSWALPISTLFSSSLCLVWLRKCKGEVLKFWCHVSLWKSGEAYDHIRSDQSLSRVRLCDPMNHSTPGLPVHHQLPEFTQTHVHRVGDAIQPSHPLSSPSPPALNPSQHQSLFQWVNSSHEVAKVLEFQL